MVVNLCIRDSGHKFTWERISVVCLKMGSNRKTNMKISVLEMSCGFVSDIEIDELDWAYAVYVNLSFWTTPGV